MPEQTVTRPLIVDRHLVEDSWVRHDDETAPAQGPALVPLAVWQAAGRRDDLAPWLSSDTELTPALAAELQEAPLVAIDFPKFTDGRGYSIARLLRERHGYRGQIRAVGDVLIDQLFYMSRCGVNAFSLREDQVVEDALRALYTFSRGYQPGTDDPEPLFRRRMRELAQRRRQPAMA
ncbi:uncharacterized protein (DUF934 family) [Halomonas fontilapidosi]|uniref:Uncharacterized protein (DUF934 family) n=1 Tax=Halomonas fontilapidosi TaxID=616675 RepID=A0A7W5GXP3_9GAMM|nr:DUF934 domain-containing protein [Halomonas fontilapidosi]MBB3182584.1 uncharacterized protein (DUF934 family) [Halomonas fontilapidosi]